MKPLSLYALVTFGVLTCGFMPLDAPSTVLSPLSVPLRAGCPPQAPSEAELMNVSDYMMAAQSAVYHGWQSSCSAAGVGSEPCGVISYYQSICMSHDVGLSLTETHVQVQRAAELSAAVRSDGAATWVRARAPINDGFWVRALFVMNTGMWATAQGLPFFVELDVNATCGTVGVARHTCGFESMQPLEMCLNLTTCDGYFDPLLSEPSWEQYFEPVHNVSSASAVAASDHVVELDAIAAWDLQQRVWPAYPETYASSVELRTLRAAQVAAWVRPNAQVRTALDREWSEQVLSRCAVRQSPPRVLGVHMRGTDKFLSSKVGPDAYFPLIDAFLNETAANGQW